MNREIPYSKPISRRLRIFSFDPALAAKYELAGLSTVTIEIPWDDTLRPGPIDEYLEIIDVDPASDAAYAPVDLNAPELLATDGLAPSESDPRFHQQMVYAVARKTIDHFERALGRKTLWAAHRHADHKGENYVPRLRIYPHALREQNAYYSPQKKALLFGYFPDLMGRSNSAPGTFVFTCLSHDIIAHETTHALLDAVHPRFNEPVNPDVLAFHEAFADIVALFQHFSYPGVLRDQIARTRGDFAVRDSLLGQLAQQFAQASGRGKALRIYLGKDAEAPNPTLLSSQAKPHARGAILVAAVFRAFHKVYDARTRDLFRIASDGTGVLPDGDLHPDLVNRLAEEAERCAERVLQMCIRAIDFCPPVGITFGAYLRAIVTADRDINPGDRQSWRLAFIESFREWGISPPGVRSMAEDSLLWPTDEEVIRETVSISNQIKSRKLQTGETHIDPERLSKIGTSALREIMSDPKRFVSRMSLPSFAQIQNMNLDDAKQASKIALESLLSQTYESVEYAQSRHAQNANPLQPISLALSRYTIWENAEQQAIQFHGWLMDEKTSYLANALGLIVDLDGLPKTISAQDTNPLRSRIEIHSIRTVLRRGPLGWPEKHMVVVVTQRRAGFFDPKKQLIMDQTDDAHSSTERDFVYRAGCTLVIDPEQTQILRIIRTPGTIADDDELDRMRSYLLHGITPSNAFFGIDRGFGDSAEPFALLHRHAESDHG